MTTTPPTTPPTPAPTPTAGEIEAMRAHLHWERTKAERATLRGYLARVDAAEGGA